MSESSSRGMSDDVAAAEGRARPRLRVIQLSRLHLGAEISNLKLEFENVIFHADYALKRARTAWKINRWPKTMFSKLHWNFNGNPKTLLFYFPRGLHYKTWANRVENNSTTKCN